VGDCRVGYTSGNWLQLSGTIDNVAITINTTEGAKDLYSGNFSTLDIDIDGSSSEVRNFLKNEEEY